MADFLEVDNAEVFDGEMEEESINRLKVFSFDNKYFEWYWSPIQCQNQLNFSVLCGTVKSNCMTIEE